MLLEAAAGDLSTSTIGLVIGAGTTLVGAVGTLFALLSKAWTKIAELEREKLAIEKEKSAIEREKMALKDEVIATIKEAAKTAADRQAIVEAADRQKSEIVSTFGRAVEANTQTTARLDEGVRRLITEGAETRNDIRTTIRDAIMRRSSTNTPIVRPTEGGGT